MPLQNPPMTNFDYQKLSSFDLPWATNWTELFGVERPLIVEIGFGNGDHLIHLAQKYPEHHVVGFEIASQSMDKAEKKITAQKLTNVRAIRSTGETALHHLFEPQSIQQIHINYPDPWFKKRHSGRRIMQRDTLDAIVNRLQIGGTLHLATDIREYAEMGNALLKGTPGLDNTLNADWVGELDGRFTTKYEEKGYREGRPAHFFIYRRNEKPAPQVPVQQELDMPHIILQTPMSMNDVLAKFVKFTEKRGNTVTTALHSYTNHTRDTLLFEVNVDEPTIVQHVAMLLIPRETDGEYLLRLGSIGVPRPTHGMHHAVSVVAEWVVSLHDDAAIIAKKTRV